MRIVKGHTLTRAKWVIMLDWVKFNTNWDVGARFDNGKASLNSWKRGVRELGCRCLLGQITFYRKTRFARDWNQFWGFDIKHLSVLCGHILELCARFVWIGHLQFRNKAKRLWWENCKLENISMLIEAWIGSKMWNFHFYASLAGSVIASRWRWVLF